MLLTPGRRSALPYTC